MHMNCNPFWVAIKNNLNKKIYYNGKTYMATFCRNVEYCCEAVVVPSSRGFYAVYIFQIQSQVVKKGAERRCQSLSPSNAVSACLL